MSVLIHGMDMPFGCGDCPFISGLICPDNVYHCECPAENIEGTDVTQYVESDLEESYPEWCPLEVV